MLGVANPAGGNNDDSPRPRGHRTKAQQANDIGQPA